MKPVVKKHFAFIAKSMLWSVLLYVVLMLAFNWDDISNKARGVNPITIVNNIPVQQTPGVSNPAIIPASISKHYSLIRSIAEIAKSIGGIVSFTIIAH